MGVLVTPPRFLTTPGSGSLTITPRSTFATTPGSATANVSSTTQTPATGAMFVALGFCDASFNGAGDDPGPYTIADTGLSLTWTRRVQCIRSGISAGQFSEQVSIWTSTAVSGSPSGTVDETVSNSINVGNGGGWHGFRLYEVSGQAASPIGLASSLTPGSGSSITPDLGGVPASTSGVFTVVHDDNDTGITIAIDNSFTLDDQQNPSWGAATGFGYKNGSAAQTVTWSGFVSDVRLLAAALEIKAA